MHAPHHPLPRVGGGRARSYSDVCRLADRLAAELRELVLPHIGAAWSRGLSGRAAGGDTTFAIDEVAEAHVEQFMAGTNLPVALYSEDRGLVTKPGADWTFIVDPIDGTRPAVAGLEAACVSVAVASGAGEPVMDDVHHAVVVEIKEGGTFTADRGKGVSVRRVDGQTRVVTLSAVTDLSRVFWTIGFRGRPAAELVVVLGELIDTSSVDGGVFDLGSATYGMTRLLTGQLDAYVDVGPRMLEIAPGVEKRFRQVGKGAILNNSPHDVAASTLILQEGGCMVTDAAGRSLGERPLMGSDAAHQMSVIASTGPELHAALIDVVARGMGRLEEYCRRGRP